ncbi:GIY-YIG nuclease family protein [Blastococcus carthaginiensis]
MDALTVAEKLCGPPTDADGAHATLPRESGLYAWWAPPGSLSDVSGPAHPSLDGLELLYVGLAQDLRTRVGRNHLRGPTGSSTLRRALVALLMSSEGYRTRWTTDRVVPVDADEERLSDWMRAHLRLTWAVHPDPPAVEASVIAELTPPLNQRDNTAHPLYGTIRAARAAYRASAGPRPQRTGWSSPRHDPVPGSRG